MFLQLAVTLHLPPLVHMFLQLAVTLHLPPLVHEDKSFDEWKANRMSFLSCLTLLPYILTSLLPYIMMSLTQTVGRKMAAFTVVFPPLSNVE